MILLAGLVTLPIWPIQSPPEVWSEKEFQARQRDFENLSIKLIKEYRSASRTAADESTIGQYKYDIAIQYGTVRGFRSILFGPLYREEVMSVAVYRACIKEGLPYFRYDHDSNHAFVTPQNYPKILKAAEIYEEAEQASSSNGG